MKEILNQYELMAPFQNKDAGFSQWTYAKKKGRVFFLKEFFDPVYPTDLSLSPELRSKRVRDCELYEARQKKLYSAINKASRGNLVRIAEYFRFDNHYYIATEKIVAEKIPMETMPTIPMKDRLLLCKSIAYEMMNLHRQHVVHADIKASNILIKKTKTGRLVGKIIDFDAGFFEHEPPLYEDELSGDQVYLAPESCQFICGDSVRLTCKIDVFALGLLFHQYLTGQMPGFDKEEYDYAFDAVLDDQQLILNPSLPNVLKTMIKGMLERNPNRRLSMESVYNILDRLGQDSNSAEKNNASGGAKTGKSQSWFHAPGDL